MYQKRFGVKAKAGKMSAPSSSRTSPVPFITEVNSSLLNSDEKLVNGDGSCENKPLQMKSEGKQSYLFSLHCVIFTYYIYTV